jgi:GNAT superfamily N-acetyltransferase
MTDTLGDLIAQIVGPSAASAPLSVQAARRTPWLNPHVMLPVNGAASGPQGNAQDQMAGAYAPQPGGRYIGSDIAEASGLPSLKRGIQHVANAATTDDLGTRSNELGAALPEVMQGGPGLLALVLGMAAEGSLARDAPESPLPRMPSNATPADFDNLFTDTGQLSTPQEFLNRPLTPDHIWNDPRFQHRMALTQHMDPAYSPTARFDMAGEDLPPLVARQRAHDATNRIEGRILAADPEINTGNVEDPHFANISDLINLGRDDPAFLREVLHGELGPYSLTGRADPSPLLGTPNIGADPLANTPRPGFTPLPELPQRMAGRADARWPMFGTQDAPPPRAPDAGGAGPRRFEAVPLSDGSAGERFTDSELPRQGGARRLALSDGAGNLDYRPSEGGEGSWRVASSFVDEPQRGTGRGLALYEELLRRAREAGVQTVQSDGYVSADARRIYDALERRGYKVTRWQGELTPEFRVSTRSTQTLPTQGAAALQAHGFRTDEPLYTGAASPGDFATFDNPSAAADGERFRLRQGGANTARLYSIPLEGGQSATMRVGADGEVDWRLPNWAGAHQQSTTQRASLGLQAVRGAQEALRYDASRFGQDVYRFSGDMAHQPIYRMLGQGAGQHGFAFRETAPGAFELRRTQAPPNGGALPPLGAAALGVGLSELPRRRTQRQPTRTAPRGAFFMGAH